MKKKKYLYTEYDPTLNQVCETRWKSLKISQSRWISKVGYCYESYYKNGSFISKYWFDISKFNDNKIYGRRQRVNKIFKMSLRDIKINSVVKNDN